MSVQVAPQLQQIPAYQYEEMVEKLEQKYVMMAILLMEMAAIIAEPLLNQDGGDQEAAVSHS